jgi:hypothetical protein
MARDIIIRSDLDLGLPAWSFGDEALLSSSWEEPLSDPKDLLIPFLVNDRPWMLNDGRPSTLLNI